MSGAAPMGGAPVLTTGAGYETPANEGVRASHAPVVEVENIAIEGSFTAADLAARMRVAGERLGDLTADRVLAGFADKGIVERADDGLWTVTKYGSMIAHGFAAAAIEDSP